MTKITIKTLSVALLFFAASSAMSQNQNQQGQNNNSQGTVSAPELDPASAMGALTLLVGTVAIVRGFRRKAK